MILVSMKTLTVTVVGTLSRTRKVHVTVRNDLYTCTCDAHTQFRRLLSTVDSTCVHILFIQGLRKASTADSAPSTFPWTKIAEARAAARAAESFDAYVTSTRNKVPLFFAYTPSYP